MSFSDEKLPKNGITAKEASDWTAAYQTAHPNETKAFSIPIVDLLELLTELGVLQKDSKGNLTTHGVTDPADGIRAYLAIGPDPDKPSVNEDKLVLVGTVDGEDQVKGTPNPLKVTLLGSGAFDLTRPCPTKCDVKSPLYHS
ncbi:MAG: hypothetical protein ACJA1Z_003903 [Patiriisocius sp.]|jgi:hypothetical protein